MINGLGKILYRAMNGTRIFRYVSESHTWLKKYIEASGIDTTYRLYVPLLIVIPGVTFIVAFSLSYPVHLAIVGIGPLAALLSVVIGVLASAVSYAILVYYPVLKYRTRRDKLRVLLLYATAYLNVLAAAGYSIESLIAKAYERSDLFGFDKEFGQVVNEVAWMGRDIISSLRRASDITPLPEFSVLLNGLAGLAETGGNISEFLRHELVNMLREREAAMREVLNSLGMLMEVFITLLVVFPMITIILMSVIASLGGFPIDPLSAIFLMVFIVTPTAGTALLLAIDAALSKILG